MKLLSRKILAISIVLATLTPLWWNLGWHGIMCVVFFAIWGLALVYAILTIILWMEGELGNKEKK